MEEEFPHMRRFALVMLLLAGCGSAPAPPASASAPAAATVPPTLASPEDRLATARAHFEAGRYAQAADLARLLGGREAEELAAMALLACGRELQALAAYEQLAKAYPANRGYAQIYRGLHNRFLLKRTDHYLNRAAQAYKAGRRADSARLVEAALDTLYSQQGTAPDPRRLRAARELRAALNPPAPPRPAPPPVRLVRPKPAPTPVSYPKAQPRASAWRPSQTPRRQPAAHVPAPPPERPREVVVRPPTFTPRPAQPSRVASMRAGESLLRVRGATMQPYSGGSGYRMGDYPAYDYPSDY